MLPSAKALDAVADGQPGQRGIVIGDVVLIWGSREHATGEIGYVFRPAYGGQGFATEAVRALLEVAFGTYRLHRVTARIYARNLVSLRLAERAGCANRRTRSRTSGSRARGATKSTT